LRHATDTDQGGGSHQDLRGFKSLQSLWAVLTPPNLNAMAALAQQSSQGGSPSTSSKHTNRQGHALRTM